MATPKPAKPPAGGGQRKPPAGGGQRKPPAGGSRPFKPAPKRKLKDDDFRAELRAYADAQRELIRAECDGFATDPAAREARREQAQGGDFRYFCRTYFPHYIRSEESAFQAWFYDHVPKLIDEPAGRLIDLSAPRGEAKSTLGTQLHCIYCIVTGRKHYLPIVMDAWDQAATMLEAIKTELTDNPRLAMDWPEATGRGRVWNTGVILTANNRKVQAFGSGKRMRGIKHGPHRPDMVYLDDIENDDQVRQAAQRDKLESWVLNTVLNLGPPEGTMDVLYLNTILHHDSVANRFHRKPRWVRRKFKAIIRWPDRMDLWEQWEALFLAEASGDDGEGADDDLLQAGLGAADAFYRQHEAQMLAGAVVSWPTVRPLLKLMQIRSESHHAFDCEYQNDPTNDEVAAFTNMQYWVQPCRDWVFYGAHDPSMGKLNKRNDPCACGVGGWDRAHGKLSVVEALVARIKPEAQIGKIIGFQREYNCIVWGIEAIQFQEFFRQQLVKYSAEAGVPVPAVAVSPHSDKDLRIQAIAPHANNGLILFHQRHTVFNRQVRHWPEDEHDDGPDMLEMLWQLCIKRAGGIPRMTLGKRRKS